MLVGDTLTGNGEVNRLTGGLGDDTLEGRAGADFLYGGGGSDTASYKNSGDAVQVTLSDGNTETGGHAQGDTLDSIENLIGSDNILTGDTLTGDGQANRIEGGLGADTLTGGLGIDTYVYHYTTAEKDGADTIAEVDKGNIIELYFEDSSSATWGEGNTHVYFFTHTDDLDAEVRLVFRPDPSAPENPDTSNYILLSRADILDERFELKAYDKDGIPIDTLVSGFPVDATALTTAYNTFKSKGTLQDYTYPEVNKPLTELGPVTITLGSSFAIPFSGTAEANLEALLTSGRFSYEVNTRDMADPDDDQLILTFGNNNIKNLDDTPKYPERTLTINYPLPESITFVDSSNNKLEFLTDNFLTSLDALDLLASTMVDDTNKGSAYFIRGTSAETDDTADFSMVTDSVTLDLAERTGTLDGHDLGVGNIEHITGGSAADTLTGDSGDNTLIGLSGNDQLFGGAGNDKLRAALATTILFDGGGRTGSRAARETIRLRRATQTRWVVNSISQIREAIKNSNAGVTVNLKTGFSNTGGHAANDVLSNIKTSSARFTTTRSRATTKPTS